MYVYKVSVNDLISIKSTLPPLHLVYLHEHPLLNPQNSEINKRSNDSKMTCKLRVGTDKLVDVTMWALQ
ncbi:hypothetical protein NQ315_005375 [Exocentrus adspersus]|uniref:Uncharacterized protein n=1 Tax=Exocentrus adspersus TaxID=1586481 RepID=A0AAV8W1M2_9CUCU|nr:hypothetical protein NQ315_005375 [Exocentrus adspersus]